MVLKYLTMSNRHGFQRLLDTNQQKSYTLPVYKQYTCGSAYYYLSKADKIGGCLFYSLKG